VKAFLNPFMAIFFSLFAAAVIIAEVAVFLPALSFLNPFGRLVQMETFIGLDCSLMVVMSYIVFCVYYSLFKLKFASYYGLYWNRQTDASSLMFFAMYPTPHLATAPACPPRSAITSSRSSTTDALPSRR
jgi:hypothetical protein